jgi:hypothetical protein
MLSLACAASYARAGAPATPFASDTEYPISGARELIVALRGEDPAAHKTAKAVLAAARPEMIIDLLRYGHRPAQREMAQKVVVMMGRKAVPTVFNLLSDRDYAGPAGSVLFRILASADAGRIPELLACANGVAEAKGYCAQALVKVSGPQAAPQTAVLAKALESSDPMVRTYAAAALGRIGRGAAAAAPILRKLLEDASPEVRAQAKKSLKRVGG